MVDNFRKGASLTDEKLTVLEFQRDLLSFAAGKNLCGKDIELNPTSYRIATTGFLQSKISVHALYLNSTDTSPLAEVGKPLKSLKKIKVSAISISDLSTDTSGLLGLLKIELDGGELKRQPVTSRIQIKTKIDGVFTLVTQCLIPAQSGGSTGQTGAFVDKDTCISGGGRWVEPPAPRPAFCNNGGDILEWY